MFDTDENIYESFDEGQYYLDDNDEDDDDDDDNSSQQTSKQSESNHSQKSTSKNIKISKKNSFQKKKSSKLYKRDPSKKNMNETSDQSSINQDIQSRNQTISNINFEKEEIKKNSYKMINSSNRIKSNEISEGIISSIAPSEISNQSHQLNYIYGDQHNGNTNNLNKSRDSESFNSNIIEIQQLQDSSENENKKKNKKTKDKANKKMSQNFKSPKQQPQDSGSIKNINDFSPSQQQIQQQQQQQQSINSPYAYSINKCQNKTIEDFGYAVTNLINKTNGELGSPRSINPERGSIKPISYQSAKSLKSSKKFFTQQNNSTNFEQTEFRYSIDNMLLMQGLLNSQIAQVARQSILNQRNSKKSLGNNAKHAELLEKQFKKQLSRNEVSIRECEGKVSSSKESIKSIKDTREERSMINLSNLLPSSNNQLPNKLAPIKEQSQNVEQLKVSSYQEQKQIVERLSHMLISNQLPLLLQQYSAGMSFREMQSMNPQLSMDYFDKMQNFKKFFPQNNFEKVVSKLKSKLMEQKRLKKQKVTQKVRRQNIVLVPHQTRISVFNGNSGFLRYIPQEYNPELYKPTYLSYGVGMRKGVLFPVNAFTLLGQD